MEKMKEYLTTLVKITGYSMKMFFRDRAAIFFSLFLPLLIMLIFGILDFEGNLNVRLTIIDKADNQISEGFVSGLSKVGPVTVTEGDDKEAAIEAIENEDSDMLMILPKDFGALIGREDTIQEIPIYYKENTQSNVSQVGLTILKEYLDGYTHQVTGTPYLFELAENKVEAKDLKYIDYLIPGIVGMGIMFMSMFGVVGAIVSWRERGVMRRLLATPIRPSIVLVSQVITRLTIAIMQAAIIILLGIIFFDLTVIGNFLLIFLIIIMGAAIFLTFGFAISGVGNSQNTATAVANLFLMPQMFLSGTFFPRDTFPEYLKVITDYLPLTYLNDALRLVMVEGRGFVDIKTPLIGLTVWIAISFFAATKLFKWE